MPADLSQGGAAFPRAQEVRDILYSRAGMGVSSRYRTLDRHEAFYRGLEYAHLDYDWNGYKADLLETISPNVIVPSGFTQPMKMAIESLRTKRPTAPLRLAPMVVDRFTGLLFSKERTPEIVVEGDAETEDFLRAVARASRLWATMYTARTYGGSMGSVLLTVHLRDGRFAYAAHNPKTVHDIIFDDAERTVVAGVLIQYPTIEEFEEIDAKTNKPTGNIKTKTFLYRRIIDSEWDLVFKPAEIVNGRIPDLEVDEYASVHHQLGFCPAVWIQNLPVDSSLDGAPDCEGAYQMFDTIDRLMSQANFSLLANMDPTLVIEMDPKIEARMGGGPLRKGTDNAIKVGLGGSASYLESSATAVTASISLAKDFRQAALDRCQCVLADPEKISGAAQSGKAIEFIYAPMLEKGGRLRDQYGPAIEQLLDLTARMGRLFLDPDRYVDAGVPNAVPRLRLPPRVVQKDSDADNPDVAPETTYEMRRPGPPGGITTLRWGPYFAPSPQDVQLSAGTLVNLVAGQLIDQETGTKLVAPLLGIQDPQAVIRAVREEADERQKQLAAMGGIYGEGGVGGNEERGPVEIEPSPPPGAKQGD